MSENPNQVATVDLKELQKYVRSREFPETIIKVKIGDAEQEEVSVPHYRELSNLATIAYIPSLARLDNLQTQLDEALKKGDLDNIKAMQKNFEDLRKTCFDDLCDFAKSGLSKEEYVDLEKSRGKTWNERIRDYNQISRLKDETFLLNERLIVPTMNLVHNYIEKLEQFDLAPNKIKELQQTIQNLRGNYNSQVEKFKRDQEKRSIADLDRNGFVIRKDGQPYWVKSNEFGQGSKELLVNNLKEYNLSKAQIDFIACHCNQLSITGTAPGILAVSKPCANLVIDIQSQGQGKQKVLLKSVSYNNYVDYGSDNPSPKWLGTAQLSVDISSLGKEEKYVPGGYDGVSISLSSDFFHNKQSQLINYQDHSIPVDLLKKSSAEQFQKDYEIFGEGYLKEKSNQEVLDQINDTANNPALQQCYIKAKLFTDKNTFNQEFYKEICQKVYLNKNEEPSKYRYVEQETLDQAVAESVVSNMSKVISRELNKINNDPNNSNLDNKNHQKITDKVYESLGELVPSDKEKDIKKSISELVLGVSYDKNFKMDLRQKVKVWWNKVVAFVTGKNKAHEIHRTISRSNSSISSPSRSNSSKSIF